MPKFKDLTGMVFGNLTVESFSHSEKGRSVFNCICSCGTSHKTTGNRLMTGNTESCGGYVHRSERLTKHGKAGTQVHNAWIGIKQRCLNPNCDDFELYGAKGITISEDFKEFINFYNEIGDPPKSSKWSVDRIDNNKGYEQGNIRWATDGQQAQHRLLKSTNKTGITGVATRAYKSTQYFIAHWVDSKTNKNKTESFNINKLGLMTAFYLANSARTSNIMWLNTQGKRYSSQHGTDRKEKQ